MELAIFTSRNVHSPKRFFFFISITISYSIFCLSIIYEIEGEKNTPQRSLCTKTHGTRLNWYKCKTNWNSIFFISSFFNSFAILGTKYISTFFFRKVCCLFALAQNPITQNNHAKLWEMIKFFTRFTLFLDLNKNDVCFVSFDFFLFCSIIIFRLIRLIRSKSHYYWFECLFYLLIVCLFSVFKCCLTVVFTAYVWAKKRKKKSIHLCAVGFCLCVQPIRSRSVFSIKLIQNDEQTNCEGVTISSDTSKTTGRTYKIVINKWVDVKEELYYREDRGAHIAICYSVFRTTNECTNKQVN